MPGRRPGAGFASRTANVSRQLTDAERSVHGEVDSALEARPIHISSGMGSDHIMRELDRQLEFNDKLGRVVAGRQNMAYAQSGRIAIAKQAENEENELIYTDRASQFVAGKIEQGMDARDASYEFLRDNPEAASMRGVVSTLNTFRELGLTEDQRRIRDQKEIHEGMSIENDINKMQLDAKLLPGNEKLAIQAQTKALAIAAYKEEKAPEILELELEKIDFELQAGRQAVQDGKSELQFNNENRELLDRRKKLAIEIDSRKAENELTLLEGGSFMQHASALRPFAGAESIVSPEAVLTAYRDTGLRGSIVNRLRPELKTRMAEVINTYHESEDPEEKRKAHMEMKMIISTVATEEDDEIYARTQARSNTRRAAAVAEPFDKLTEDFRFKTDSVDRTSAYETVANTFRTSFNQLKQAHRHDPMTRHFIDAHLEDLTRNSETQGPADRPRNEVGGWLTHQTLLYKKDGDESLYDAREKDEGGVDHTQISNMPKLIADAKLRQISVFNQVEEFANEKDDNKRAYMLAALTYKSRTPIGSTGEFSYELQDGTHVSPSGKVKDVDRAAPKGDAQPDRKPKAEGDTPKKVPKAPEI